MAKQTRTLPIVALPGDHPKMEKAIADILSKEYKGPIGHDDPVNTSVWVLQVMLRMAYIAGFRAGNPDAFFP